MPRLLLNLDPAALQIGDAGEGSVALDLAPRVSVRALITTAVQTYASTLNAAAAHVLDCQRVQSEQRHAKSPALRLDERRARISAGLEAGKVAEPTSNRSKLSVIDIEPAVAAALVAFERREFQIAINGEFVRRLDDLVDIDEASEAVFLRLVPLRGG